MTTTNTRLATRTAPFCGLAFAAGCALSAASAATNLLYAIHRAGGAGSAVVWGAVALAVSATLVTSLTAALQASARKEWGLVALCLTAFTLSGAYSITAALGAAHSMRGTATATADKRSGDASRWQNQLDAAQRELAALPPTEPAAALAARVTVIKMTEGANRCEKIDGPVSRRVCPEAAQLEQLQAKAARRSELETGIKAATEALASLPAATAANADAQAVSDYAAAVGLSVPVDSVNRVLALLAVLILELGGPLAFSVSHALRSMYVVEHTEPVQNESVQSFQPSAQDADFMALARSAKRSNMLPKITVADDGIEHLLALVRNQGGEVFGGQRTFAKALNVSTGAVNELIKAAALSGRCAVETTTKGTRIRLAA